MWQRIADFVLRFRVILLVLLFAVTGVMGYFASRVELSYDFTSAIPTDNPKYQDYQHFRQMFGEDGSTMMLGIQSPQLFTPAMFRDYTALSHDIAKVDSVTNVLGVPAAIKIMPDSIKKIGVQKIFP